MPMQILQEQASDVDQVIERVDQVVQSVALAPFQELAQLLAQHVPQELIAGLLHLYV